MKTGVIIYIAGDSGYLESETREVKEELNIEADRIEVVSNPLAGFDIHNAAWRLIVAGMQTVVCMTAICTSDAGLKLTGRELRLCG